MIIVPNRVPPLLIADTNKSCHVPFLFSFLSLAFIFSSKQA